MKYKVLLTGKNNSVIEDFFTQMNDSFESLSTSVRHEDIIRHVKYFIPDLFIYCLYNESRDNISQMVSVKYRLAKLRIPFIIIGSKEDCDEFERIAVNIADLVLLKPLSASAIQENILKFMEERQPLMKETDSQPKGSNLSESPSASEQSLLSETPSTAKQPALSGILSALEQAAAAEDAAAKRRHILVVDDDPMMLKLIKEHLRDKYDIATAISGKIAMKFLEHKQTDLILLDYEMPEENGPAVLEKLRSGDSTKDIPVVFLTGVTEREKIQEALILKPQGYLLKPIDRDKLMATITKVIKA